MAHLIPNLGGGGGGGGGPSQCLHVSLAIDSTHKVNSIICQPVKALHYKESHYYCDKTEVELLMKSRQ